MDNLHSAILIIKISLMGSFGPRRDGYVCMCVFIKARVFASGCMYVYLSLFCFKAIAFLKTHKNLTKYTPNLFF